MEFHFFSSSTFPLSSSLLQDAKQKVEDAKKDTCEAIGKVCDVAKTCALRSVPLIGGWLCKVWSYIVDAVCSLACSVAKGVLSVVSGVRVQMKQG